MRVLAVTDNAGGGDKQQVGKVTVTHALSHATLLSLQSRCLTPSDRDVHSRDVEGSGLFALNLTSGRRRSVTYKARQ